MKIKLPHLPLIVLLCCSFFAASQDKYERAYRIQKSQFPDNALTLIDNELDNIKRIKFYKETDSLKDSFEAKFKKDRLWYSVEFDQNGILEDIEILINEVDIPSDELSLMINYFKTEFSKFRIKKIQQQYPVTKGELKKTLKDAFQNLLLPSINYEFIVAGKKDENYLEYEILFDAKGNLIHIRKSLPPNYDHVLY